MDALKNKKSKYRYLFLLVFCFLLVRLSLLLTDPEATDIMEEKVCGVLAHDVVSGHPIWNIFDYQYFPHAGGTLVISILEVPLFFFFDQSLIALKVLPLFFSIGALVLWYLFLYGFSGQRAAFFFGLFFIFCPSYFARLNLTTSLGHIEENFFTIAIVSLFFKILFDTSKKKTPGKRHVLLCAFGLISGIGLYCFNQVVITLFLCLVLWCLVRKKFMLDRAFLFFLTFFLVGFSPWILYNLSHNFQGPKFLHVDQSLSLLFNLSHYLFLLKKFLRLTFYNLPCSMLHDCEQSRLLICGWIVYWLLFLLCWCTLFVRYRDGLKKVFLSFFSRRDYGAEHREFLSIFFILAFPFVFLAFYTLSSFDPVPVEITTVGLFNMLEYPYKIYRYRLFLQVYPFLFATIALGLDCLWVGLQGRYGRRMAAGTVLFIVVLGCCSILRFVAPGKFGKGLIYKGYNRDFYSFTIIRHSTDLQKTSKALKKFGEEQKQKAYRLLGVRCAQKQGQDEGYLLKMVQLVPEKYRRDFIFGYVDVLIIQGIAGAKKFFQRLPEEYQPFCYEAYGFRTAYHFLKPGLDLSRAIAKANRIERFFYQDIFSLHREPSWDIAGYNRGIEKIEKCYQPWCYRGLGRFLAKEVMSRKAFKNIMQKIDESSRLSVYEGFIEEKVKRFLRKRQGLFPLDSIFQGLHTFYFEEIDAYCKELVSAMKLVEDGLKEKIVHYARTMLNGYGVRECIPDNFSLKRD